MNTEREPGVLRHFRGLYWRLSGAFLSLLIVLAIGYAFITTYTAEMYYQEAAQRLNAKLGSYLAAHTRPFSATRIDDDALRELFSTVMFINPSVEVYLLDSTGRVLAYSAPDSVIKRHAVRMEPVQQFVENGASTLLTGDDPRSADGQKAFSAAPIIENGRLRGYYYVILGSEQYASSLQMLEESYIVRVGFRTALLTLVAAAVIGLLGFAMLTRHLHRTIRMVRRFQQGDRDARIPPSTVPELDELASAFNDMADAITRQIEEIKTMDALRRDLVANISHDLRTPLVSIHGYVETILMKDHTLNPDQRRSYLDTILKSTNRLKRLVEELLELSKLEARQIAPTLEHFSIAELVQDVIQKHRIQAEGRGTAITTRFPQRLPFVLGDIGLLERVFQNLLDNAIHYTPPGGAIAIVLTDAGSAVRVSVEDTGTGIAPEELTQIFDRFRRGGSGTRGGNSGSGLGLAIVKKILDIHGVTIEVTSRLDQGTVFSFLLPYVPSVPGDPLVRSANPVASPADLREDVLSQPAGVRGSPRP